MRRHHVRTAAVPLLACLLAGLSGCSELDQTRLRAWFGGADSRVRLASYYARGKGVAWDEATAVYWYRKAAEQGSPAAQYAMGVRYDLGMGVAENHQESVTLYRRAAEQGFARAQLELGLAYATGVGVERDLERARMWLRLAADSGASGGDEMLALTERFTAPEVAAEGDRLARAWRPRGAR